MSSAVAFWPSSPVESGVATPAMIVMAETTVTPASVNTIATEISIRLARMKSKPKTSIAEPSRTPTPECQRPKGHLFKVAIQSINENPRRLSPIRLLLSPMSDFIPQCQVGQVARLPAGSATILQFPKVSISQEMPSCGCAYLDHSSGSNPTRWAASDRSIDIEVSIRNLLIICARLAPIVLLQSVPCDARGSLNAIEDHHADSHSGNRSSGQPQ